MVPLFTNTLIAETQNMPRSELQKFLRRKVIRPNFSDIAHLVWRILQIVKTRSKRPP